MAYSGRRERGRGMVVGWVVGIEGWGGNVANGSAGYRKERVQKICYAFDTEKKSISKNVKLSVNWRKISCIYNYNCFHPSAQSRNLTRFMSANGFEERGVVIKNCMAVRKAAMIATVVDRCVW